MLPTTLMLQNCHMTANSFFKSVIINKKGIQSASKEINDILNIYCFYIQNHCRKLKNGIK